MHLREVLEDALAPDARVRIFARWVRRQRLVRPLPEHRDERVDTCRGEDHDARLLECLRDQRRDMRVHRPG